MRHKLWIIFPTAIRLQGRATFGTFVQSFLSSYLLWTLCFSALPFDSWLYDAGVGTLRTTFFLHQLAPGESHQQETGKETGRQEEEGGTWSFFLLLLLPGSPTSSSQWQFVQSLTLSLAPPELASLSHIRGTRMPGKSPLPWDQYQLGGVLLPTSRGLNTPTFSLCFPEP